MSNHISSAIINALAPIFSKKGEQIIGLMNNWQEIATTKWHKVVFPNKFVWNNNNQAILILSSTNNLVEKLVMHDKNTIIYNANKFLGYKCIIDIKFLK